jgi:hypothetical protein
MIRTNVMLTEEQHAALKRMAKARHRTLGELVRAAVDSAYPVDMLEHRRNVALAAYQEGMVSLGRLAEAVGLDPVSARAYCAARGITPLAQDAVGAVSDADNA